MAHTPGPWHFASDNPWCGTSPTGIFSGHHVDKIGWIKSLQVWPPCACDHNTETFKRHVADMALIAAAPELLTALKDMVDIVTRNINGQPGRDDVAECWDRARDAIAKAEGQTN